MSQPMRQESSTPGPDSRLPELIALARERSSEKRREMLRELTDQFFGRSVRSEGEVELYGELLAQLSADMETAVRAELARRFATALDAPPTLIRRFAADDAGVAEPVLRASPVLTDDDLMEIARDQGQRHLRAVSSRASVSEAVSDIIVERSDDDTLGALLRNGGARLSRQATESAVARAKLNPALHAVTVERKQLPPDLLNEMYFVVESQLREQILARNAMLDPAILEEALATGRARVAAHDGLLPDDYLESRAYLGELTGGGPAGPHLLPRILRSGNRTAFLIALARLSETDFHTVSHIVDRRELDALAVLCKAANLDGALFLTIAVALLDGEGQAMGLTRSYSLHYAELGRDAALRTLRFWRLRRGQHA